MDEQWLLEGDPAVRWRVLRDLIGASDEAVRAERARVAAEGWGARLLKEQNAEGGWGEGDYSPKWTSTTYTLLRLIWLGLLPGHPAALQGCERLWEWRSRWRSPETCVAAILVRVTCDSGYPAGGLDALVAHLIERQQKDGGWNCQSKGGEDRHGSFHTSVLTLEALEAYAGRGGPIGTGAAAARGREFFLEHRLYQSHRTGEVAIPASLRFPAFPEWHFDVLRGLEYFRACGVRDERLGDAVDIVRSRRTKQGRWSTYSPYAGKQFFALEPPGPSRWNTTRARAILKWWESP
ncbi:hypothetical protein JIG36_45380 [Actinoplanes sp. LDG1-06]|uniref:Squalene cyclase C-terminal domain-containing protein n=1 Tax=Paractinoplanes ovalisporus TaxID=2810368 RepID=A0ABS2AS95_9ACTN|nr:hypothetical protein [Actinoplanes ovalisporus]MBM2622757.1 hypothetical protein [Actinoplanes ovalisporus]